MPRRLLRSLAVALSFPCALPAQADNTAAIGGYARSSFNGRPLAGVMISVPAARKFSVTDSTGRFALGGLPAGRQRVRVVYEGRNSEEYDFELKRGKTKNLAVMLDVEAIDLAPVVVEATHRDFARNLAGFYERRKWYGGFARFYTKEDLERRHPVALSQLLTTEGIFTRCLGRGCLPVRWSRGKLCAVAVSVDGMPFWEQDYDHIAVSDVQAVEVYRSAFSAPSARIAIAIDGRRDPFETPATCGAVAIWTR